MIRPDLAFLKVVHMVLYGKQPGGSGRAKPARRPCNDADETPWCMHCGGQWGGSVRSWRSACSLDILKVEPTGFNDGLGSWKKDRGQGWEDFWPAQLEKKKCAICWKEEARIWTGGGRNQVLGLDVASVSCLPDSPVNWNNSLEFKRKVWARSSFGNHYHGDGT